MILPPLYPLAPSEQSRVVSVTVHWLEGMVIGLNLCPFAKAVHIKGQIGYLITAANTTEQLKQELQAALDTLVQTPQEQLDTVLLMHPKVLTDFIDYNGYLKEVNTLIKRNKLRGVVQVASFHPDYEFAGAEPSDAGNYTNRSPYPILHLLREASIDKAVSAFPDPARIFEHNIERLRRLGVDALQQWVDAP